MPVAVWAHLLLFNCVDIALAGLLGGARQGGARQGFIMQPGPTSLFLTIQQKRFVGAACEQVEVATRSCQV
jgi:hypothetical protein